MDLKQLNKGNELREKINDLNQKQKTLIDDFKHSVNNNLEYLYLSFNVNGGRNSSVYKLDRETINKVFTIINNTLMKKITDFETEFNNL